MKGQFFYAPLYYIHSQVLGERLGVGLLLVFPKERKVIFKYPSGLTRLTQAYDQVPDKLIKRLFQSIGAQCEELNTKPGIFDEAYFSDPNPSQFLQPDDSALQFDPFRSGASYDTPEAIAAHYASIYLGAYEGGEKEDRHDDHFLGRKYKDKLREKAPGLWASGRIKEDYIVKSNDIVYHFPFAWENGSLNLVRPLSFDVKREETIFRKAERYFGQFSLLKEDAEQQNWKIDVLVAPPAEKHLLKPFEQALKILERPSIVRLHEEKDVRKYVMQTIEEVR